MEDNTKNILDKTAEKIGKEFNVVIEDGVMKITPPEAGIAIFSYISLVNNDKEKYEMMLIEQQEKLEKALNDVARLRSTMDMTLDILSDDDEYEELCVSLLQVLYPITGVLENGLEIDFSYDEERDNDSGTK